MKRWLLFLVLAVPVAHASTMTMEEVLRLPELDQRQAFSDTVSRWFLDENFAGIENFTDLVREHNLRTGSGAWVLELIYGGIDDAPEMADAKTEADWRRLERISRNWQKAWPQSVTAKIAHAHLIKSRGWFYRGHEYARSTSERQFALFHRQVDRARDFLLLHPEAGHTDPQRHGLLLNLIGWQKNDDPLAFANAFEAATERFPDYYPIYFAAISYHVPKWGGTSGRVEAFAQDVMRKVGGSAGKVLYTRMYWSAVGTQFRGNSLFVESEARWEYMREGFQSIVEEYPSQWSINHYARFACLALDKTSAQHALGLMSEPVIERAWRNTGSLLGDCRSWVGYRSL